MHPQRSRLQLEVVKGFKYYNYFCDRSLPQLLMVFVWLRKWTIVGVDVYYKPQENEAVTVILVGCVILKW